MNNRILSITLVSALTANIMISNVGAYSINNTDHTSVELLNEINTDGELHGKIEIVKNEDKNLEYTVKNDEGNFVYREKISDDHIHTDVYKLEDGNEVYYKTIESYVDGEEVKSTEYFSNGVIEKSSLRAENVSISNGNDFNNTNSPILRAASNKKYLRTEKRGISLIGKKVSISAASAAIAVACTGIGLSAAAVLITQAIAAGAGTGVQQLPDYIYETRKVYRTKSNNKMYTRYEGKFYLNSARTQYIGAFTYSRRGSH